VHPRTRDTTAACWRLAQRRTARPSDTSEVIWKDDLPTRLLLASYWRDLHAQECSPTERTEEQAR
jgi:hypothetical protein